MSDPAQQSGEVSVPTITPPPPPPPPPPPGGWQGEGAGVLAYQSTGTCDPAVLEEITRIQQKKSSWTTTISILVISLLAFIALGMTRGKWDGQFLAILVGALFFHEGGHYIAMRLSGYQNLKMFFIPFLGAAVSGQCYNVPGWKKVVVSLMGPVPGIIIGIPLGIVGILIASKTITSVAMILLFLNGLNLLPLLPLDGGHIVHNLLFSRNVYLDIIFRCIAAGLLVVAALLSGDRWLWFLAVATGMQIPLAYRLATVVAGLRREGFVPVSHDDKTIPPEIAGPITGRIRAAFPKGLSTRHCARHTISVFEALNARPPGWPLTIAFLIGHGAALVSAVVFGLVFLAAGMQGRFAQLGRTATTQQWMERIEEMSKPKHELALGAPMPLIATNPAEQRPIPAVTIVASFPSTAAATKAAASVQPLAPAGVTVMQFADSVLIPLPTDDSATRDRLFDALSQQTKEVFVTNSEDGCHLTLIGEMADPKQFAETLGPVLAFPGAERLRMPWDPRDTRSADQKARDFTALQTSQAIISAAVSLYSDARWQGLNRQIVTASERGDKRKGKELQAQQQALRKTIFLEQMDQLASKHPEQPAMITAGRDLAEVLSSREFHKVAAEKLGPFVGQMPADEMNRFGARSGHTQAGKKLMLTVTLISPTDSLPVLIQWLRTQGVTNLRYDLTRGYSGHEYVDEEDGER